MDWDDWKEKTLGEVAALCPGTWEILEAMGAELCFCGFDTIEDWIESQSLDEDILQKQLAACLAKEGRQSYSRSLTKLTDHIVSEFHHSQRSEIHNINAQIKLVAEMIPVQEVQDIAKEFSDFANYTLHHFDAEEKEFFPQLKSIDLFGDIQINPPKMTMGTLSGELKHWEEEHMLATQGIDAILQKIVQLKSKSSFAEVDSLCDALTKFVPQFKRHVHFENFVLLPACLYVEQALAH